VDQLWFLEAKRTFNILKANNVIPLTASSSYPGNITTFIVISYTSKLRLNPEGGSPLKSGYN